MARNMSRTGWYPITLEVAFESSVMEVLLRSGRRDRRTIVRALFRTRTGKAFSSARLSRPLQAELERLAAGPPLRPTRPKKRGRS